MKSEWGESEINVPCDRNGTFEPRIIEKRQTRTDDIEARIVAMYAKGMSNCDIEDHLRAIYGEASASLISRITDKITPAKYVPYKEIKAVDPSGARHRKTANLRIRRLANLLRRLGRTSALPYPALE